MQRHAVYQFDSDTFVVADLFAKREICICGKNERGMDAKARAHRIATLLNLYDGKTNAELRVLASNRQQRQS